jgi:hypothetical protein
MGIPVDSSKLITCEEDSEHDLCFTVVKNKSATEMLEIPIVKIYITSWEVNLSRYIMMDLNEFPWAAIITFFPDKSWGSICSTTLL